MTALRDAALGYWKMGLRPIPCGPRTKVAAIRWSEYRLRQPTRGEVERRWIEIPDANIALVMGNGMFALDLDGIGAERLLEERGIILPPSAPRSRTAKGFHVILASPRPVPNRIRLLGDPARGIDVRGDGGLIVVPPSIHPSGVAYEWVTPLVMLPPAAPEALLALIANAAGPTSSRVPTGDWVLDALQGVDEGARDATCTRLAGLLLGRGLYPEVVVEMLAATFAPRCNPPFPRADVVKCVESIAKRESPWREPQREPVAAIDALDLLEASFPDRSPLIQGVIEQGTVTVLGGAPKTTKSLLVQEMALAMVTGTKWEQMATARARVLIIQSEMPARKVKERLIALLRETGLALDRGQLMYVNDRSLRLDTEEGQARIVDHIERVRPDLLVCDPLARMMTGDENSGQAMNTVIAFLDSLVQSYGIAVLLVHHTGKSAQLPAGGASLRGHSALWAAADTILMLKRKAGERVLTFEQRYAAPRPPLTLRPLSRQPPDSPSAASVSEKVRTAAELATGLRYMDYLDTVKRTLEVSTATAKRLIRNARASGLVESRESRYWLKGSPEGQTPADPAANTPEAKGI